MSDTPETIAAILAEMRDDRIIRLDGADVTRCLLHNLADRIEAASERERDEARKARDEAREKAEDALWELAELRERAPGNAAAIRDALVAFVDSIQWLCDGDERGIFKKQFAPLLSEARAALAAPARNCDRFKTADEARDAVKAAFANTMLLDDRQLRAVCGWLFAPAEGGDHA